MSPEDEYFTIKSKAQAEIKIKGSRFIGTAAPANSVAEADQYILQLQKQYYNATHNCYAFRVKSNNQITYRFSDAGEPSGTAGPPIHHVLQGRNLLNIVVVITRYFGGTKLGKGGLIRAYTDCTKAVLDSADLVKTTHFTIISFIFPYELIGHVMHSISQLNGNIKSSIYDQQVELTVEIPLRVVDTFKKNIIEVTSGKVQFK